jgi:type IV pilus assembly protein PilM
MAADVLIGLDIGSTCIRAVQGGRGKTTPTVTHFGVAPLPAGAVQAGFIYDGKAVTAAVRQLWSATKLKARHVVVGITNPQIVVRPMSVSNLPAREMRSSLPFQVRDALPLAVEKSLLDFQPLEDPGKEKTVRGLLVAAPKEPVIATVHAIEQAGLHVARVDVASLALLRSVSRLDGQVEAIVDIGAQATTVVVHADGEPLIVRTVPRGGSDITEKIATRLGANVEEAESLKCRVGLRAEEGPETADVIREAIRPLLGEVRSSFAYVTSGERHTRVARLVLSGGSAGMPGLAPYLAAELGVEVIPADPSVRVRDLRGGRRGRVEPLQSSASISVGLTLRAA